MNAFRHWIDLCAVNEAFIRPPLDWRWTERKDFEFVGKFSIEKNLYVVSIFRKDHTIGLWELSFAIAVDGNEDKLTYRATGTGNAWTVYGMVVAITRDFIRQKQPKCIEIDSDVSSPKRLAINRRIADAIAAELGYHVAMNRKKFIEIIRDDLDDSIYL